MKIVMKIVDHIIALDHEGALLADTAARTDPAAPVPTCPQWQLRDLVLHTGRVHRWATAHLRHAHPVRLDRAGERAAWGPDPSDHVLVDWFRAGHAALVETFKAAPDDLDCWTFLPAPGPLAFWARRQAHETAVHRIDAEAAAGIRGPEVAAELALDGIDELLHGFMAHARAGAVRSEEPRTVLVRPTDGPGSWLVGIGPGPLTVSSPAAAGAQADLVLDGRACDLYLLLWNRPPAGRVELTGDGALLDLWREQAAVVQD
ncbi:maleylpyruvate isomerase family mycothiol-dependent enzyme [Kitasatospora sp. NBC_01560]|uniref:maleylpyruvate isomerase family mycothiol-dependent enzyme n=1 Tax=Kitasatospora sp. NBC_01560 TaxID=2975965 RepID=UPI00386581B2